MKISFERRDSKSQSSQNENFLMVAFLFTSAVMGKGKKKGRVSESQIGEGVWMLWEERTRGEKH